MFFSSRLSKISNINKTILRSSFWILFGVISSKFFLLVASIIVTKLIDKTIVGEFSFIRSTINMFTVFAGFGLGVTATKYIAQYKNDDPNKAGEIIGISNLFSFCISLVISIILIIYSNSLANNINAIHLTHELKFSAIILFFAGVNGVQAGILAGFQSFKSISINNFIAGILSSILQIIGAYYFGLNGLILGFGANYMILYFLNYISIHNITKREGIYYSFLSKSYLKHISIIYKFSLPAVLSGLIISPVIWISNRILISQSHGFDLLAEFEIANQWRSTILFIPGALAQVALPMLAGDSKDFNYIFKKNLNLNILISIGISIMVMCLSPFIISFYDSNYQGALLPLNILIMTTCLVAINGIVSQVLTSKDLLWQGLYFNILWAIVFLSSCYIAVEIFKYGILGLSLAYLVSYIFHTLIQFYYLKTKVLTEHEKY